MGQVVLFLAREQRAFLREVKEQIRSMQKTRREARTKYVNSVIRRYADLQDEDHGQMLLMALENDLPEFIDQAPG